MAQKSKIEWTETTWNPITGCTKISEGCTNCYAEVMARRLCAMGQPKYKNGFNVTLHPQCLDEPLKYKKPHLIFVCSMSDLFHKDVPDEYIQKVFETMNKAGQHTFQILTKRSERLRKMSPKLNWTPNIWAGVTVESGKQKIRIPDLTATGAKIKWLSVEPLLTAIDDLPTDGIDWVVVGGESGPKARPMKEEWVLPIRDKCLETGTAFYFKQWGGLNKKVAGNLLQGEKWEQMKAIFNDESITDIPEENIDNIINKTDSVHISDNSFDSDTTKLLERLNKLEVENNNMRNKLNEMFNNITVPEELKNDTAIPPTEPDIESLVNEFLNSEESITGRHFKEFNTEATLMVSFGI